MEIIFTFTRTHDAIQAEQCLLEADIPVKAMSLPSSISAGCGICLRVSPQDMAAVHAQLQQAGIRPAGLYTRHSDAGGSRYSVYEEGNA